MLGAEVVRADGPGLARPVCATSAMPSGAGSLRATGHTASDQVETILYRLVTSGNSKGIKARREDGVVRPLLPLWREETEAFCVERGVAFRLDSTNPATTRGLIRDEILPLLERIHPAARENILRSLDERRTMPPALAELLDSPVASRRVDLGGGLQAVREHDRLWLERGPVELARRGAWGGGASARSSQALSCVAGGPATGSPAARRRSRTCSSTPNPPLRPRRLAARGPWGRGRRGAGHR